MYDYIIGKITSFAKEGITIEAGGIGYKVITTSATSFAIQEKVGGVKLYVAFVVREFAHSLFGFLTSQERDLFEALLDISGVGPKMALALIGHITPHKLMLAVAEKDIPTLCKIPGIGKKTAERLLVELKDVLAVLQLQTSEPLIEISSSASSNQLKKDAVSALINLGYSQFAAQKAVKQAVEKNTGELDLSSLISLALKEAS